MPSSPHSVQDGFFASNSLLVVRKKSAIGPPEREDFGKVWDFKEREGIRKAEDRTIRPPTDRGGHLRPGFRSSSASPASPNNTADGFVKTLTDTAYLWKSRQQKGQAAVIAGIESGCDQAKSIATPWRLSEAFDDVVFTAPCSVGVPFSGWLSC